MDRLSSSQENDSRDIPLVKILFCRAAGLGFAQISGFRQPYTFQMVKEISQGERQ
jgi:hypothetical protein